MQLGSIPFRGDKYVSAEDVEFFYSRLDENDILNRVDKEIRESSPFEWVPKDILSKVQLNAIENRKIQHQEHYDHFTKYWKDLLSRPKESNETEVISRPTTEKLVRKLNAEKKKEANNNVSKIATVKKVPGSNTTKAQLQHHQKIVVN